MGNEHSSAMMSLDVPGTVRGWRDAAVNLDSGSASHGTHREKDAMER